MIPAAAQKPHDWPRRWPGGEQMRLRMRGRDRRQPGSTSKIAATFQWLERRTGKDRRGWRG